jgi:NADPH:quinone reductase-like Zn-dependent oxidoreductase
VKAIRFHQHGGPEVLALEEVPDPPCPEDGAVLEIRAAGVNHLDLWVRRGLPGMKIPLPRIPGADAAGVVREVGPAVTAVAPGQRVLLVPQDSCGQCEFCGGGDASMCREWGIWGEHGDGTYAERIAVPAHCLWPIPDALSFEAAAAAPLALLTAWRLVVTRGRLRPGEDVLIHGVGAGVGTFCLQLAKLAGARAIVTASSDEKLEKARRLGADVAINYAREDWPRRVREATSKRGVDLVVDYIGKETWAKSLASLRRGGRLVTCGATTGYDPVEDLRQIFYRQLEVIGCTMGSLKEFSDAMRCLFAGRIAPVVDAVLPLADAAGAHRRIESRQVFGKVVLAVTG